MSSLFVNRSRIGVYPFESLFTEFPPKPFQFHLMNLSLIYRQGDYPVQSFLDNIVINILFHRPHLHTQGGQIVCPDLRFGSLATGRT